MRHGTVVIAVATMTLLCVGASSAATSGARATDAPLMSSMPITAALMVGVRPSSGPLIPVIGDSTAHLAYELYVTNFSKKPVRINSLTIRSAGGAPFESAVTGDELKSWFIRTGTSRQSPQDPVLAPGASGVIFVFLNFATQQGPARLSSAIVVGRTATPRARKPSRSTTSTSRRPSQPSSIRRWRATAGKPQMAPRIHRYIGVRSSFSTASRGCRNGTLSTG